MSAARLNGDRHESVLAEGNGRFRVYCGCGWQSFADASPFVVEKQHDAHVAFATAYDRAAAPISEGDKP